MTHGIAQRATRTKTSPSSRTSALAWLAGGILWLVAGVVHADGGWRFDTASGLWIAADVLILAGLLALYRLRPHGASTIAAIMLGIAVAARIAFIGGEVWSQLAGDDENPLIPVAAVLTAVSLAVYGGVVVRRRNWTGPSRYAVLAMGLYPVVVMFPVVAATGEPSYPLIALWGIPTALVGLAVRTSAS